MKIQHGIEPRYDPVGEIFLNGGRYTLAEQLGLPGGSWLRSPSRNRIYCMIT
ncbi:MAG: hypothetical protein V7L14_28320 [Nostoc sp.]|uniref:hypothetical protein n=1 Tax=Nostoc sp. TaxID=1180 RepID=UPI002FF83701